MTIKTLKKQRHKLVEKSLESNTNLVKLMMEKNLKNNHRRLGAGREEAINLKESPDLLTMMNDTSSNNIDNDDKSFKTKKKTLISMKDNILKKHPKKESLAILKILNSSKSLL